MPQYILLLYENPSGFEKLSPEEMQAALEKYMAWTKKPFMIGSRRLKGGPGRVIRPNKSGQARVTDGPFGESKEVLGGYYAIEAADFDEAVKRTLDHPHLQYGGTIEVRELWSM